MKILDKKFFFFNVFMYLCKRKIEIEYEEDFKD